VLQPTYTGYLVIWELLQFRALGEDQLQNRRWSNDSVPAVSREANLGSLGRGNALSISSVRLVCLESR
jgi:hypothetical protein